jgi:hypothetical protein
MSLSRLHSRTLRISSSGRSMYQVPPTQQVWWPAGHPHPNVQQAQLIRPPPLHVNGAFLGADHTASGSMATAHHLVEEAK